MPDQRLNQQRLENYLSACMYPAFDVAAHMEASQNGRPQPRRTESAGTSTPRDLNTRLKLLELYTLHVLPRNEQWDYAKDFINMSEVLDDERREAFLGALQTLREEKSLDAIREAELKRRQEEEAEKKAQDDQRRKREEAEAEARRRRETATGASPKPATPTNRSDMPSQFPVPPKSSQAARARQPGRQNRPTRKTPPPPLTFYQRASATLLSLQSTFTHLMQHNPMALFRYVLFVLALLLALARRDLRQRLRRMFDDGLRRIGQTIGAGTKVSHI